MHSSKLDERQLLHRLSKIDEILAAQEITGGRKNVPRTGMSMEEALAVYMESVVPVVVTRLPEQEKPSGRTKKQQVSEVTEVVEASHILYKQKENASEHKKQKKEKKNTSFQECMEGTKTADNTGSLAYDRMDCSNKEAYLLYSYDKTGCHSIIGKDINPGSYGGSITRGDFKRKA